MRLVWGGGGPFATAFFGLLRVKWLALHLETAGLGVIGQIVASQAWLGTASGLGLGFPLTRAIGRRLGENDPDGVRRAAATAAGILAISILTVTLCVLLFAGPISTLLFGSAVHANLVRISTIGIAGLACNGLATGLFAGHSDLRAAFTMAATGGAVGLLVTLALVPRFGVAGGVLGVAVLTPAGVAAALLLHRRRYGAIVVQLRPRIDAPLAREMLAVAGAGLLLALVDQGALLGLRAHYVRVNGVEANGLLQAALALAQQIGAPFFAYLFGYAFAKLAGMADVSAMRDYTRRHWTPLALVAALAFGAAMAIGTPLLHLFYSDRFDPARPLLAWTMLGEFGKLAGQTWALAALPLGGTRLWLTTGMAFPLGMLAGYVALAGAAPELRLPLAYATGGGASLVVGGIVMTSRGVGLGARELGVAAIAAAGLAWLAVTIAR